MDVLKKVSEEQIKTEVTPFAVGDTVKVYVKIVEGDTERVQAFSGTVIAKNGSGIAASFTVRRVAFGQGVERVFKIHSPRIDKIEVTRRGDVRRAKLYYLRDKVGKSAKVKELRDNR